MGWVGGEEEQLVIIDCFVPRKTGHGVVWRGRGGRGCVEQVEGGGGGRKDERDRDKDMVRTTGA